MLYSYKIHRKSPTQIFESWWSTFTSYLCPSEKPTHIHKQSHRDTEGHSVTDTHTMMPTKRQTNRERNKKKRDTYTETIKDTRTDTHTGHPLLCSHPHLMMAFLWSAPPEARVHVYVILIITGHKFIYQILLLYIVFIRTITQSNRPGWLFEFSNFRHYFKSVYLMTEMTKHFTEINSFVHYQLRTIG